MESMLMSLLGLFGLTEPLIDVDIRVDIQFNVPGVERKAEREEAESFYMDEIFMPIRDF